MAFVLMEVTYDRNTGEKSNEKIIGKGIQVSEDCIYNLLAKIFYKHIYRKEW